VEEAVSYLGINVIKHLALAVSVFRQGSSHKQSGAVSKGITIEKIQEHAMFVGWLASQMLTDKRQKEDAFLAGLLHDVGKVILLTEVPEQIEKVLQTMQEDNVVMYKAEEKLDKTTHAEIGGYLLGIWGLPYPVVEAVANHHAPTRVEQQGFDILAAVYLANELANEVIKEPTTETQPQRPNIDINYLKRLGVSDRLKHWRLQAEEYHRRFTVAPHD
jgi:putative nucleotidyltransferase with HDIG domain